METIKKRDVHDWISLLITVLGLCGVWYYAYWARVQGHATQLAAEAARKSAETAQQQLTLSERPWVLATHKIDTPLTFYEHGSAVLIIEETLQKSGQSAAIDVWSWAEMADLTAALKHQAQDCDQYRRPLPAEEKGNQTGFVLLLKQGVSSTIALGFNPIRPGWDAGQKVSLVAVGCISYRTLFEAKDAPKHQTRFAYFLGIPGANQRKWSR